MVDTNDTIIARATPLGTAGVAIVRLSGPAAFALADDIFQPAGHTSFIAIPPRYLASGTICSGDRIIDHCLAVRFPNPHSFTGDDVVEFHLHGNVLIAEQVIELGIAAGARLATAGEFTKRAFMNGKIDLTQVEALADLLASESEQAISIAQKQLHGELRRKLDDFRQQLLRVLALLELELDFVEDGYHFASLEQVNALLDELRAFVDRLLGSYHMGNRLRNGPRILLLGRPNAGKSSLFNAFVGYSRALVSPVEGTTRDYLEERISYGGVQFRFVDTAGLRSTSDSIEAEGVSRAYDLLGVADHVFYLIDGSMEREAIDQELAHADNLRGDFSTSTFSVVLTKADRGNTEVSIAAASIPEMLTCSIYDRPSVERLLKHLLEHYNIDLSESIALVNQRQYHLLIKMREILGGIGYTATSDTELLSADLRALLGPLSELTGEVVNDDILNLLFSSFCIGK